MSDSYERRSLVITTNMEDKPAVEFKVNLVSPEGTGTTAAKK